MRTQRPDRVGVEVGYVYRRRRLTVALRDLLVIPHVVILVFLGIASGLGAVIGWFAALVLGRLPAWAVGLQCGVLAWQIRVLAYGALLVDRYPPFRWKQDESYPVRLRLAPGRLNRLAVLFRIVLVIPAAIVGALAMAGVEVLSVLLWVFLVVGGRMPRSLFQALASVIRYYTRLHAYGLLLLTATYPSGLFAEPLLIGGWAEPVPGHGPGPFAGGSPWSAAPVELSGAAKALVGVCLVAGVAASTGSGVGDANADAAQLPTQPTIGHSSTP
ncbi:MAG TPA: DUF4389 domain-containing protein [Jatrophihabitantaceae bacterium]|jgi:hypothetical protein